VRPVLIFVAHFTASVLLVESVRRWALRRSVLDIPSHRSSHTAPTPRGGGVAIVLTLLPEMAVFSLRSRGWLYLTVAAAAVALIGWIDDIRSVSVGPRLIVQLSAAIVVMVVFGPIRWIALPGMDVSLGWFSVPLTLLWVAGLTNAYNFMDGIDGIAGAEGVAVAAGIAMIASLTGRTDLAMFGVAIAGSCAGFLVHNWERARIFMGDVGSSFVGFVFAGAAVSAGREREVTTYVVLFLVPFLFDSSFTFFRRLFRHENVLSAHRSHLYQRLTQSGLRHHQVALLYCGMSLVEVATAAASATGVSWSSIVAAVLMCTALWIFTVTMEHRSIRRRMLA